MNTDGAHGKGLPDKEGATAQPPNCSTAQRPAYCFVPVRLTILRRYPLLEKQKAGWVGWDGGGGGELVELKVEGWKNWHPQGAARTSENCCETSSSGMYDDSWSRSVFLEGLEAQPTYEQSLTSSACVSPEILNCWGAFRLQRHTHTGTLTHWHTDTLTHCHTYTLTH